MPGASDEGVTDAAITASAMTAPSIERITDVPPTASQKLSARRGRARTYARGAMLTWCLSLWAAPVVPALAGDYRLASGDVLGFAVAGAPDLKQDAAVGPEGAVSLPLVGEVSAAGRTLADLRAEVRSRISQKELRFHTGNVGTSEVLWPDQVSLSVVEFRPVFLDGDVAKPGAQRFKPGMTVRQALSMAGGLDVLRFRMDNPFIEASDLRGAYEGAWIDEARERIRLDRLRVELGDGPRAAAPDAVDPPVPKRVLGQLRDVEAATLKARLDDDDEQRAHLASLVAQYDADIAILMKTHGTEADGMQYDEAEFKRVDDLYKQGTLPLVRVVEARRVMLLSATQALQSQVEIEQARKEREIARRKQESFDADRRKTLLAQIQDSQAKLFGLQTRLSSIADKLLYVGALKTQLRRGAAGGGVVMTLHRSGEAARPVDEDAELQPADVVEISLKAENDGALAADVGSTATSPR